MRRLPILIVISALGLASVPSAQQADALASAAVTLGAADVRTLEIAGAGASFSVGQNYTPSEPWPRVAVKNLTASANFDSASMRLELLREMGATMPRGGGAPFTGEQRQVQLVSGGYAWNMPASQPERLLMLWAIPQGFVKAAIANHATTKNVAGGTEVAFTINGKHRMVGLINAQHQVSRVQTWIDQSIVGDMLVETEYSGYQNMGGVMFPTRLVQRQDGFPALDLTISSVKVNPPVDIAVPDAVRTAQPAAPTVTAQKLADGVFHLTGGSHHSLAVEMRHHIVLVDVPNGEARAVAVIAKAKEAIPNKPIRYLVTTHHHWDHLGGIRAAVDEGATIVSHQSNKAFLERVAKSPHTINPDRLAASKKSLKLQTVGDKGVLTDGARTIELHRLLNYEHTGDMLVVYLPKEKMLVEVDAFTPPAQPTQTVIAPAVPYAAALYDNIKRLNLDVQVIAPLHGARLTDVAEVARNAGRTTQPGPDVR
jgi:glyoxylase-like metal-dependent hydrolase (beta-lactamase superfamily II)